MREYVIYYTYKGQQYTTVTKPCTRAQARAAFDEELNSLNSFTLVRIVAK
jgi:hypothetical protein